MPFWTGPQGVLPLPLIVLPEALYVLPEVLNVLLLFQGMPPKGGMGAVRLPGGC
jgi:hypothetical protein